MCSENGNDSDADDPVNKNNIKRRKKSMTSISDSGFGSEKVNDSEAKVHRTSQTKLDSNSVGLKDCKYPQKTLPQLSDSEDEAFHQHIRDNLDQQDETNSANDFDVMMAKKKSESGYKRKKSGVDMINENEENIAQFVRRMRDAANQDRQLNMKRQPATKKLSMFNITMQQINKVDLIEAFLEANLLSAITDWMSPMPDKQPDKR